MEEQERDFIPPNRLQLSYQFGMDGRRRIFSIPKAMLWGALVLLIFLILCTLILFISASRLSHKATLANRLATENRELRLRMEQNITQLSSTLDSISVVVDSLKTGEIRIKSGVNYPYVSGDQPALPYLKSVDNRIDQMQEKLQGIINTIRGEQPVQKPTSRIGAPSIYPCFGRISDSWGLRMHPILNRIEFHMGIDISNNLGTAIYATASGVVKKVEYEDGYGKFIRLDHENGYETIYAHLYSAQVNPGDRVEKGQIIGLMGSTGLSTGPHLHYEVLVGGERDDPAAYLNFVDDSVYVRN